MNLENFNPESRERLDDLETEMQIRGTVIIGQLIYDIQENDWYCIQNGSESNLHEWEKALLVAGLESLQWEKATFDDLIEPLLTLAGLQIDKGNHEAVEICKAVIKLIYDIQENDWYCIQNGSESNLHEWEKALLVAGLESLMGR